MKPRALALTGPTTSGKTTLSLALAHELHAEIISMDSRQVYRGMDIGTDKVTADERRGIPHFGLDLVDPDEPFNAGRWARAAHRWITQIEQRHHLPLLVGGTGFFLRALLEPLFREPEFDPQRRRELQGWLAARPQGVLEDWVRQLDPARAELAIQGGRQRLSRTLEVALLTGRPLSQWHAEGEVECRPVECVVVVLELDRAELDRRIDARVGRMVERGFLDEVRTLMAQGYEEDAPGMTGTGYREAVQVLRGQLHLDEALERMRRQTRQYARRQMTWVRNQLPDALRVDALRPLHEQVAIIAEHWRSAVGAAA